MTVEEALAARVRELETALARATHLAEHLWQMVDSETWRDTGGDDGQGHYEGDYHAEQTREEIQRLAALTAGDSG